MDTASLEAAQQGSETNRLQKRLASQDGDTVTRFSARIEQQLDKRVRRHNRAAVERVSLRDETTSAPQIAALTGEHAPTARPLDDRGVPEPGDAERRNAGNVEVR
jgi:hypothetical protein